MNVIKTAIEGVVIIVPRVFKDGRGYFFESFSQREFDEKVRKVSFVQDNESMSVYGVMRGLHFQRPPFTQSKLVRCVKGAVLDVALDIRKGSSTYGEHVAVELTEDNHRQFFVPRGFAHGFAVLRKQQFSSISVIISTFLKPMEVSLLWTAASVSIGRLMQTRHCFQRRMPNTLYSRISILHSPLTWICIQNLNKSPIRYLLI